MACATPSSRIRWYACCFFAPRPNASAKLPAMIYTLISMNKKAKKVGKSSAYRNAARWLRTVAPCLLVVLLASAIFAIRYQPAFVDANFYAEDGKVFISNVIKENPVATLLTGFNGYLVVGQYVIAELAVDIQQILGLHFYQVPVIIALLSCLFLGITVSLPFLLFRKQLGATMSLLLVLFSAFIALPSSDYAIIGTIGNLKFAYLYWAFMFVLYRVTNAQSRRRVLASDAVLLFSVLTYAPAIALLPFGLIPYRKEIIEAFRNRNVAPLLRPEVLSLFVLGCVGLLYMVIVFVRGIPPMPGYLDAPYKPVATMKLVFHSTWYAVLFPLVDKMRDSMVLGLLALTTYLGLRHTRNRLVFALAGWAIFVGTASFVINRTGISDFFLSYAPGPDQFFYAQRLIFIFLLFWMFAAYFNKQSLELRAVYAIVILFFLFAVVRFTGSFGGNQATYASIGDARAVVSRACADATATKSQDVTLSLYPSAEWQWTINTRVACR